MHAHRTVRILTAAGLAGSAFALGGCQTASPAKSAKATSQSSFNVAMAAVSESDFAQQHQFYYYPDAQVYRDCDEDRWLWSADGGFTWQAGATLPQQHDVGNEIPFAVFLTFNEPATEHQAIAAAYPADHLNMPAMATVQGKTDFE